MSRSSLPTFDDDYLVIKPIGVVHSCFKEKFGIPRQPGLVPEAKAIIELLPPFNAPEAVEGLDQCSHIWIHFLFHANRRQTWKPKVKPPRLGGNKSMGVFATRSPIRPNPIGLSVVALKAVVHNYNGAKGVFLAIAAHDLLDGTPVIDIKPYVPYADALPEATNTFANKAPHLMTVSFDEALELIDGLDDELKALIINVLSQDPRPAYKKGNSDDRVYGMRLDNFDVRWQYSQGDAGAAQIKVVNVIKL